jgi:predicted ArsR family transcriptional regulator
MLASESREKKRPMVTMQQQARALGDPTRHGIFQYLVGADQSVTVAELTDHFGLNHNAIRQHLAKLLDAQLVVEDREQSGGRGRPRLLYVVDPRAESRWGVAGPYERLSLWLSEMVRTGDSPVDVGRRVGRRRRLGPNVDGDPVAVIVDQMARHGFDPAVTRTGDKVELKLQTCPFASTALADPDTICELHLGIAEGVAERVEGLVVDELIPRDPRRANCRLRCHLEPARPTG